jgi:uncharacterized protein (TIGR02996 family)
MCEATPDDDTPRLVWADREGGECGRAALDPFLKF